MGNKEYVNVVENHIGRKLLKGEVIHHINGNHFDNRIENLKIVTVQEHVKIHHLGKKRSLESRHKMSASAKGKHGGAKPEGFGDKISKALTGKPKSLKHRANLSKSATGRKISEVTKQKMSASRIGKIQSAETKAKRSVTMKELWKKRRESKSNVVFNG